MQQFTFSTRLAPLWRLGTAVAVAAAVSACSFLNAVGEITVGAANKIPKVSTDLKWPGADQVLGKALTSNTGSSKAPPGLPTALGSATLAHVQGIMTIDGECNRSVTVPGVDSKDKNSLLKNLNFTITNCGDANRCVEQCQGFHGMKMEARIQFQLLNAAQAKKIKEFLSNQTSPDAVVAIRATFTKLDYYEAKFGKPNEKESITKLFANSEIGVSSPGGGDDTVLVKQRYLPSISPTTPQVFALDQKADFTLKTKKAVINAQETWIEIFQRIAIPQQNLYGITLGGGGVELELQPEFVINAVKVVEGAL